MKGESTAQQVAEARKAWAAADAMACDLESLARTARRQATALSQHYESVLAIHQGQETLPYDEA